MSKVVPLHGGSITDDRRPDEEAVRQMNALAEMVRAGEITGFVLICEQHRLIRKAEGEDQ